MSKHLIRPHHLFCTRYFEGKGYSEGFTENMGRVLRELESDDFMLVKGRDDICKSCPNLESNGLCKTQDKAERYDKTVLINLGLKYNTEYNIKDIREIQALKYPVKNKATKGLDKICGDCQWFDICNNH